MTEPQSEIYKIFCICLGDDSPISVEIERNKTVNDLKDAIKAKAQLNPPAHSLKLYQVDIPDDNNLVENVRRQMKSEPSLETLRATTELSELYEATPPKKTIHILVKASSTVPLKRGNSSSGLEGPDAKRTKPADITSNLVEKWSRPVDSLDFLPLRAHLHRPLAEDEKVPIPQREFDLMLRDLTSLNPGQLATLFRVSEEECAPEVEEVFRTTVKYAPPPSGTDDLFHYTWDNNISRPLKLILQDAEAIRNTNHNTSTGLKRPDYGLLIKNNCILRGEEKGSESPGDPGAELVDKLIWTYSPLPYVLGYYATTTEVTFVAITKPPSQTQPASIQYLFSHNLHLRNQRVTNLVHLIRLSGVVAKLGEMLNRRFMPEYKDIMRDNNRIRMSFGAVIRKEFLHENAPALVSELVRIYELLKSKKVPNVDKLERSEISGTHLPYVELSPIGVDRSPKSGSETLDMIICILEALTVMHSDPLPVYHRDIREPNIMKNIHGRGWFLIDWSDACIAPTRAVTHLKESEHSPRVREDGHGAEVDIWSVGKYLESLASRVTCGIANPDEVVKMARKWMSDHTVSAAAALKEIKDNRSLFTAE